MQYPDNYPPTIAKLPERLTTFQRSFSVAKVKHGVNVSIVNFDIMQYQLHKNITSVAQMLNDSITMVQQWKTRRGRDYKYILTELKHDMLPLFHQVSRLESEEFKAIENRLTCGCQSQEWQKIRHSLIDLKALATEVWESTKKIGIELTNDKMRLARRRWRNGDSEILDIIGHMTTLLVSTLYGFECGVKLFKTPTDFWIDYLWFHCGPLIGEMANGERDDKERISQLSLTNC